MSFTQQEFDALTRNDREKHKFALDANGNVCIRFLSSGFDVENPFEVVSLSSGTDGAELNLYHDSPSPAQNDVIGVRRFYGNDSLGNKTEYAGIYSYIAQTTDTDEYGILTLKVMSGGVLTDMIKIDPLAQSITFKNVGIFGELGEGLQIYPDINTASYISLNANQDIVEILSPTQVSILGLLSETEESVASASTLNITGTANKINVTGTTTINHIKIANTLTFNNGTEITLFFNGNITITNNAVSAPTDTLPIRLAGSVNFSATANDNLTLVLHNGAWHETSRTVI